LDLTLYGVNLWAAALVFARVGALIMILPGFGEPAVPAPVRLGIALTLTVMFTPGLAAAIPEAPADPIGAAAVLGIEILVGLMIGTIARIIFAALSTAGQVIGNETGLAFAQTADPTMAQSGQIFAVFLGLMGATLIFVTDLHHLFLAGVGRSYQTFPPGEALLLGDAADMAASATGESFRIGVQIAAPLILAGLIFRVGLGVLARLAPTIQVFFVTMPLSLLGGFVILALGLSSGMILWLDALQSHAMGFP
jgi:flagellar biosynthetic protein FliR